MRRTFVRGAAVSTAFIVSAGMVGAAHPTPALCGGFDQAIEAAMPRVVKLYGLGAGAQKGYGTGVVVSQDGLVLTVSSLLIDANRIRAVGSDATPYEAEVVARDPTRQLALLRLKPASGYRDVHGPAQAAHGGPLPFFDLSREAALSPGDWVLAAGNAFKVADGAEPVSVAHGVFSARTRLDARRRLKDFPYTGEVLVIDAITSNPGAPGSAVVNLNGEFVGMIGRQVISNLTYTHLNFAMPRAVLYDFYLEATLDTVGDSMASALTIGSHEPATEWKKGAPFDPGIRISRVGYRTVLPFVERVRAGSPAQRAGVRRDDLILAVNGRSVADVAAYDDRLRALGPDEAIDLVVRRGRAILTIHIKNVEKSERQEAKTSEEH